MGFRLLRVAEFAIAMGYNKMPISKVESNYNAYRQAFLDICNEEPTVYIPDLSSKLSK